MNSRLNTIQHYLYHMTQNCQSLRTFTPTNQRSVKNMQKHKKHFWTSFWSGQHPNAGQNIQHLPIAAFKCLHWDSNLDPQILNRFCAASTQPASDYCFYSSLFNVINESIRHGWLSLSLVSYKIKCKTTFLDGLQSNGRQNS